MKKFFGCLFISVVTFLIGFNFYLYSPSGIAETKVLSLINELHEAEQNRNAEKLRQILADKISFSRYKDERIFTKDELIKNIENIPFEVKSIKALFVSTKIEGKQARVYFTMIETAVGEDNKPFYHTGDYTYTFEKQQKEWKLISIHLEN